MTEQTKIIQLGFTTLEFHSQLVISKIKEDVILEEAQVEIMREKCLEVFEDRKFVYIGIRKHNYNVNPLIYTNLIRKNQLKAIAIVSDDYTKLKTANFEKQFATIPFELFQKREEAIKWSEAILK